MNKKLLSAGAVAMSLCALFCAACASGNNNQQPPTPAAMTEQEWKDFWQNNSTPDNATCEVVSRNGGKLLTCDEYETGSYELPAISDEQKQTAKVDFVNLRTNAEISAVHLDDGREIKSVFSFVFNINALYSFAKDADEWIYGGIRELSDLTEAKKFITDGYYITDKILTMFGIQPFCQIYSEFTFNAQENTYTARLTGEYGENNKNQVDMQLSLKIVDGIVCEMAHNTVQTSKYDEHVSVTVIEWKYALSAAYETVVFGEQELNDLIALIPPEGNG